MCCRISYVLRICVNILSWLKLDAARAAGVVLLLSTRVLLLIKAARAAVNLIAL